MIAIREKDGNLHDRLKEGIVRLSGILSSPCLIEPEHVDNILKAESQLRQDAERRSRKPLYAIGLVDRRLKDDVGTYLGICTSFPEDVVRHNEMIAGRSAIEIGKTINPVEGRDLDLQQLTSIAMDVHTRLVLAGAGTGKTTTVVGLVKYLLASGKASPDDILALSFTNASVDELRERIKKETGQRVETTTFHRLAVKVIASSKGKVPKISNTDMKRFVSDEIRRRSTDSAYMGLLNEYLVYDFDGQKDESSFVDRSEYVRYLRENPLVTLKGEKVKSFGEADIANFLAINGIPYEYEASYIKDTNDALHGQYRPDFHITGTDIYIEYFGTDRNGNVARFMVDRDPGASDKYLEGIEWKRNVHR
ncbi:MAG: UvrD-helicase domain-containing protein, partial [archaeon]|nr:UvrD-helicase domain-containing protein [archaeon]